jgi:hypothetical protein
VKPAETDEERRERRLNTYRKYNLSVKGAARRNRYEGKHPERAQRWSPLMQIKARDKR